METSTIAIITGLIQVAATAIVVKIQANQIAGLRANIDDQKASIEALKAQAAGQEAITNQWRQLNAPFAEESQKLIDLTKRNAAGEQEEKIREIKKQHEEAISELQKQLTADDSEQLAVKLEQIFQNLSEMKQAIVVPDTRKKDMVISPFIQSREAYTDSEKYIYDNAVLHLQQQMQPVVESEMRLMAINQQSFDSNIRNNENLLLLNFPAYYYYYGEAVFKEARYLAIKEAIRKNNLTAHPEKHYLLQVDALYPL